MNLTTSTGRATKTVRPDGATITTKLIGVLAGLEGSVVLTQGAPENPTEIPRSLRQHLPQPILIADWKVGRAVTAAGVIAPVSLADFLNGKATLCSNPLGIACPLCRRKATVTVLEGATHRCNYDGCRDYTWEHVEPILK